MCIIIHLSLEVGGGGGGGGGGGKGRQKARHLNLPERVSLQNIECHTHF